ncbi:hypothetical protein G7047_23305 [Diaphorobacter sp. HDW4A]|uniref:hypothetical protein n=1 Tax=Diaphorobacter sp. HDW4A TaxID=2714924 RepID=UPI0014089D0E|nr:hypothetical protein [Diaphorobacter sp. HDW4A]QIL82536.1 hypothetical protein G7047_23305 [Diaphorobacter sp. HDW4A]
MLLKTGIASDTFFSMAVTGFAAGQKMKVHSFLAMPEFWAIRSIQGGGVSEKFGNSGFPSLFCAIFLLFCR